jgi:hypothetical protein
VGSGGGISPVILFEGDAGDSRMAGKRRLSVVSAPRRQERGLTVTNREEFEAEDNTEAEGEGRASRNPGTLRVRLAEGSLPGGFVRFDM